MLMPRKVAHRKHHRGRTKGLTKGGSGLHFGEYGIQALEPGWISARQIEAEGVGYLSPRASNLTEEGRTQNRRVEVMMTSTQVSP